MSPVEHPIALNSELHHAFSERAAWHAAVLINGVLTEVRSETGQVFSSEGVETDGGYPTLAVFEAWAMMLPMPSVFRRPSGTRLTGWDGTVPPVNWRAIFIGPYGTGT
jgi:hypothetical protein